VEQAIENIVFEHDGKSVTAVFENGQHITGRLIIGTDGARSAVRKILLEPEKAFSTRLPYSATFVQAKFSCEQVFFLRSFHPLYIAAPYPVGYFAFFRHQDTHKVDTLKCRHFSSTSPGTQLSSNKTERERHTRIKRDFLQVKEKAKAYCEPWKSAFEWVPEDQPSWYFNLTIWDPNAHNWDTRNGRVTLEGDAAHPMTYHMYSLEYFQLR
jgi:2-polyprenyl-6-methoxyphenol hydroxylase-like FAD-dependent oxidoreductase